MASVYPISLGTDRISISDSKDTYITCQLVATSLDADVTVKLQHSSDGFSGTRWFLYQNIPSLILALPFKNNKFYSKINHFF